MAPLTVTLALPSRSLSPNARVHWRTKAKAAKDARWAARVCAGVALDRRPAPRWTRATVQAVFYHPQRRKRDRDNGLASLKPYLDGIADAGVVENDSAFEPQPVRFEIDRERPRVEITISEVGG